MPKARPALVIATTNPGKVSEIEAILGDCGVDLRPLPDEPLVRFPEEGDDYARNAEAKALAAARQLGVPALADDSGLEVDALGGRPGPFSARYGGPGLEDAARVEALLAELSEVPAARRGARFVCVVALADPDGTCVLATGVCEGAILKAPRGESGVGYDPIFQLEGRSECLAEIGAAEKNRLSHRALALGQLLPELRRRLGLA
jgi:XTP/dITP diphosphohydrolase